MMIVTVIQNAGKAYTHTHTHVRGYFQSVYILLTQSATALLTDRQHIHIQLDGSGTMYADLKEAASVTEEETEQSSLRMCLCTYIRL